MQEWSKDNKAEVHTQTENPNIKNTILNELGDLFSAIHKWKKCIPQ